jgi:hypothetical protein
LKKLNNDRKKKEEEEGGEDCSVNNKNKAKTCLKKHRA